MSVETIEKTFSCPDSPHLTLSNIRGSVKILPADNGVIVVTAAMHNDSGDEENTRIEISRADDGSVKIHTRYNQMGFRFYRKWYPCKVDYEVLVPKECTLKVRGLSNTATIEGISGELDISTVSGDIECRSLTGQLKIKTVSGDVLGEAISASARLNTISGDISLKNSDFPALRGVTVSGDLVIETPLGDGPYDFNSVFGDIKLDISTVSGDIECRSLTGQLIIKTVSGDVQGGAISASACLKTVSGDISLKNSDFPAVQGKTVSGDLAIETPLGDGPYDFKSVSGDIILDISPEDETVALSTAEMSNLISPETELKS